VLSANRASLGEQGHNGGSSSTQTHGELEKHGRKGKSAKRLRKQMHWLKKQVKKYKRWAKKPKTTMVEVGT